MEDGGKKTDAGRVTILGRDGCPYTRAAKKAYAKQGRRIEYVSVRTDPQGFQRLMALTGGAARVPVIVDGDTVQVGWQGRW